VNGRSEKAVAEAKDQIDQTVPDAKIESFAGDLSTAAATETLLQRFPLVDILVNNLGIFEPKPFEGISDEDWRRFFEALAAISPTFSPFVKRPRIALPLTPLPGVQCWVFFVQVAPRWIP
jgi:NAD(P)-dependent dehydrogenase (short-subunit alcohol dehydrogenase family)